MNNMAESAFLSICRICLQQIVEDMKFYFLNNEIMLQSKLLDFLPEIALNDTQNPIICNRCSITIDGIHEFKQLCLRTESIIKDLKMQQKPFEDVLNYIKTETAHETFKEELVEDTIIKDEPQIVDDDCLQINMCIEEPTKPLFYCYTCNYNTNTKRDLTRHVHSHHPQLPKIRRFKCDECSYTTRNNYCLTAHKKIHLKTETIIKDLQIQQKVFKDYVKTDTIYDFKDTIIDELQIVDDDCLQVNTDLPVCIEALTKPQLYCYTCNYNTDSKSNLVQHIDTHRQQLHQCNICDYKCTKRYKLIVHMRSHTSEKLYKTESNLTTHIKRHSNVKNYKCGKCDYSSEFKHNRNRHVMLVHKSEKIHYEQKLAKNHKCGECDYSSVFKYSLMRHVFRMHNREKLVNYHRCGECDYSSAYKHGLKSHVIHMHNREELVKNYKCDKCDYSSVMKCNLKSHVIHMHNRENLVKRHKCGECEYVTESKTALVMHIRLHTGEKPYKCNICDYRCTQASHLRVHLTTHTGEKSFICEICSYACARREAMKKHQQQHLKSLFLIVTNAALKLYVIAI